jgi:hypothetical protein
MNAPLAEAIAAVHTPPLVDLAVRCRHPLNTRQAGRLARLIEHPSTIRKLSVDPRSLERITAVPHSYPSLDELAVRGQTARASAVAAFVNKAGVTSLRFDTCCPIGDEVADIPGLKSLALSYEAPEEINLSLLAACPNLSRLAIRNRVNEAQYPAILEQISSSSLAELSLPCLNFQDLLRCLLSLPSLRSLDTWVLSDAQMEYIAWSVPRLESLTYDETYEGAIFRRKHWLQRLVVAAGPLPGDMGRELAEYLDDEGESGYEGESFHESEDEYL